MLLTDSIKAYIASAVAVLLLFILIPTGIHNFVLQSQVDALNTDKTTLIAEATIKRMEVTGLQNSIGEQNKKITDLEDQTKRMKAEKEKAFQESASRIQQLENAVDWLKLDKGKSCTAAGIGSTILKEILP